MALFEVKSESAAEDDSFVPHKKSDLNTFPRRERTPSGNVDPKGAFRFPPRLNRRNINSTTKHLSLSSLTFSINSSNTSNSSDSSNNSSNSHSNTNNNKTSDISTMASSYSSAKLAPPVAGTTVDAFELGPDKTQFWFTIQVLPYPMTIPGSDAPPVPRRSYSIYRRIEDIVDFAERLEQEFPWLKTYTDGSQKGPAWSLNRFHIGKTQSDPAFVADCSQRKQELDTYLRGLFTLGSIISQCRLVSEFFGIWKTDLKFHLSQSDQDPLALHSVAHFRPSSALPPVVSRVAFELGHDSRDRRHSTASSPPWSLEFASFLSSISSSAAPSPSLPPSPGNKRVACLWEMPPSMLDARQNTFTSPPGSSYHSSDHEDSDGGSDVSGASAESDSFILDRFPPPPPFTIKKATSLQNLRPTLRVFEPSSSPLSPPRVPSASQHASSVASIHSPHHRHTPARSFGEGTIQSELGQLGSFPPRAASLPGAQFRRKSLQQHHEIHPRSAIQDHTRSHSNAGGHNNILASTLRMNAKNSAYVSTSPLSTSPPLTSSTQSLTRSIQDITMLLNVDSGTPSETPQQEYHIQETSPSCPLQGQAPMTSTAPLSPKIRTHRKILKAACSMPSLLSGRMQINTENVPSSSPLVSPVSQDPLSPTWSIDGHKQRASRTNQKQPASILKNGHPSSNSSSSNYNQSFTLNPNALVHYQPHHPQVTSPALGAGFLAQHPQGFAATFKLVVSTDMIVALQVLEEEPGFVLSVPDLRLRVLNKFRRMSTGIPEDFELMWTGWDGTRVLLKNDEELQRALKASSNNKVTLRCIFF
ncbi:hypothetical protein BGX24_009098 [Mortierella sp. AD032]|nr:hypothetical protein BGX24_009098 [Mortierella sp. AD032]